MVIETPERVRFSSRAQRTPFLDSGDIPPDFGFTSEIRHSRGRIPAVFFTKHLLICFWWLGLQWPLLFIIGY